MGRSDSWWGAEAEVAAEAEVVIEDVVIDDFTDRRAGSATGSSAQQCAKDASCKGAQDGASGATDGAYGAADGNDSCGAGVAASSPGDSADEAAGLAAVVLGNGTV